MLSYMECKEEEQDKVETVTCKATFYNVSLTILK